MTSSIPFAHWPLRRLLGLWGVGFLVEAALLALMFVLLVRPEPPLVDRLQGGDRSRMSVALIKVDTLRSGSPVASPGDLPRRIVEDSFYTVLHWPLYKPLLAGGGRVIAMPMRRWWVPALYVGAVPLALIVATLVWVFARWGGARAQGGSGASSSHRGSP